MSEAGLRPKNIGARSRTICTYRGPVARRKVRAIDQSRGANSHRTMSQKTATPAATASRLRETSARRPSRPGIPGSMPPNVEPWQLAQGGMPRAGSPCVTIASPRAKISLLTVGTAGG